MERQFIAYALLALLFVAAGGIFAYLRYHSHERVYARRQLLEKAAYAKAMARNNED